LLEVNAPTLRIAVNVGTSWIVTFEKLLAISGKRLERKGRAKRRTASLGEAA
jgi:hypothetical protein